MTRPVLVRALLVMAALCLCAAAAPAVDVGAPAPAIKVLATDGKLHGMRDSVGTSWLIVAWYPKAMTPG